MTTTQQSEKGLLEWENSPSDSTTPKESSYSPKSARWVHTPTNLTLAWLLISIPLVIWDTGFVLLRPWSMPGGSLHWPLWVPYEIYMRTDLIYGWKAIEQNNGFTSAQGSMNVVETLFYIIYLYIVYTRATATNGEGSSGIFSRKHLAGQTGAIAVVIVFSAAVMTLSKTVLYGLNEVFAGCSNVRQNEWIDLICYYIIPNGSWLVASAYMVVEFGSDILRALSIAGGVGPTKEGTE